MAKSPEEVQAAMIAGLKDKTGKSIDEWIGIVKACNLRKHGEIVAFLKSEHGLGHGYANLVVHSASDAAASGAADGEDLVAGQYAGAKAALRPLYEQIVTTVRQFGRDVDVSPKKSYVSLRRSKQFAVLQPSTATRRDEGINLKGVEPAGRLEASGSFSATVSHRVRLAQPSQIDAELMAWLRSACEKA
jgi:hypothetical protein